MRTVIVCLTALLAGGCAGELIDPQRFLEFDGGGSAASGCANVETTVFAAECATNGCHDSSTQSGKLDLSGTGLRQKLAGQNATGGGMLIDPQSAATSVLYTKLTATPPYGARMPFGGTPLDAARLACVLSYVSSPTTPLSDAARE